MVADFELVYEGGALDLVMRDDDLGADEGLRTSGLISMLTDRRAESDDQVPGGDADMRGWWGDEYAEVDGDRIGSRLWLLRRAKMTPDLEPRAEELARQAFEWMVEDNIAESVEAEAEASRERLYLEVRPQKPPREAVSLRFAHVWESEAER